MGQHDRYGKELLLKINNSSQNKEYCQFDYGDYGVACIDGVIIDKVAIEIESRVNKQIRGSLMDLICHPYTQKLLILMSVNSVSNNAVKQAEYILEKFLNDTKNFKVVKLVGNGDHKKEHEDKNIILDALKYLNN